MTDKPFHFTYISIVNDQKKPDDALKSIFSTANLNGCAAVLMSLDMGSIPASALYIYAILAGTWNKYHALKGGGETSPEEAGVVARILKDPSITARVLMAAAAYNLLWTVRGIPCLYYGEEIEFMKGAPQDVIGNDDTLDQTGRAYFGDHLTDERIGQTQSHPLYQHLKRLNQIRRAIPALQKAPMGQVNEWGSGLSFVRCHEDSGSYAVVGLAMGGDQHISVGGVWNGVYRDAVTGREIHVGNGNLSFHVQGNSAGIYVLDGPGKIGEDGVYLR